MLLLNRTEALWNITKIPRNKIAKPLIKNQLNHSKAELVAAGATYVGIRLQMVGTVTAGTALQFYDYKGVYTDYQQRNAYGTIGYVATGTYVWVKVSELRDGTIMLSFQANVKSGSSGTMYFDNLVIR